MEGSSPWMRPEVSGCFVCLFMGLSSGAGEFLPKVGVEAEASPRRTLLAVDHRLITPSLLSAREAQHSRRSGSSGATRDRQISRRRLKSAINSSSG